MNATMKLRMCDRRVTKKRYVDSDRTTPGNQEISIAAYSFACSGTNSRGDVDEADKVNGNIDIIVTWS